MLKRNENGREHRSILFIFRLCEYSQRTRYVSHSSEEEADLAEGAGDPGVGREGGELGCVPAGALGPVLLPL